jgi:hypothetical protein
LWVIFALPDPDPIRIQIRNPGLNPDPIRIRNPACIS